MIDKTTNTTLADIAEALLQAKSVVISGHVNPDGDCLGSQLALQHALKALGKDVVIVLGLDEPLPLELCFLPGSQAFIPARNYVGDVETFVAVDASTPERLGDSDALRTKATHTITVDHHSVDEAMSDLSYTDPDVAATAVLVWEIVKLLPVTISPEIATCTMTGLVTDTGSFQYQNTDYAAFVAASEMVQAGADPALIARNVYQNKSLASILLERALINHLRLLDGGRIGFSWVSDEEMKECHAEKPDAEHLINVVRSIAGVQVACVLRDKGYEVRGSLRAKDETDVAAFARTFGGGGHRAAAGFTIHDGLPVAIPLVEEGLLKAFSGKEGERF